MTADTRRMHLGKGQTDWPGEVTRRRQGEERAIGGVPLHAGRRGPTCFSARVGGGDQLPWAEAAHTAPHILAPFFTYYFAPFITIAASAQDLVLNSMTEARR
jgi:hypothetical protein